MTYYPIIGLEVHIELKTKSKMFCSCFNNPNQAQANVDVCPICMGHPGTLPVINQEAVRKVIKTGLALNCKIPKESKFDRKNYFYPDLPKGYQISQYDKPLSVNGYLKIGDREIGITRVHLEEDTGKLLHSADKKYSLVDFNRAGIPLMELVTDPDLNSAQQAKRFAQELRLILKYLDVSEADMEKGQMRIEVNISLAKQNGKLGTKVEIKNLNSFRAVEKGIEYEIKRQAKVLQVGKKVVQETRGWNEKRGVTISQREKEAAHDYRYFPEPDLPILRNQSKVEIPELPQQRRERFRKEYGISDKAIEIFVSNKTLGEYFENIISELINWIKEEDIKKKVDKKERAKLTHLAVNYIITDLQGLLKNASSAVKELLITPENFAEFVKMIYKGEIYSKIAKTVLKEMFGTGADPSNIIKEKGLKQIADSGEIEKIIKKVIAKNPKPVADFKKGKQNALQFLVGQVMAATKGKAEPGIVNKSLKKLLK